MFMSLERSKENNLHGITLNENNYKLSLYCFWEPNVSIIGGVYLPSTTSTGY